MSIQNVRFTGQVIEGIFYVKETIVNWTDGPTEKMIIVSVNTLKERQVDNRNTNFNEANTVGKL